MSVDASAEAVRQQPREPATWLECAGCGWRTAPGDPLPLRCPAAVSGDDVDHVLARRFDAALVSFPRGSEDNPFVRYRTLFQAWHAATLAGLTDAEYVALVERLDAAVAAVDGHGFRVTPFSRSTALSERLGFSARGGLWVKDETGNVSGSHKARHLMGTLIELQVAELARRRAGKPPIPPAPLAVASCGNAALAAAVVARAAGRTLDVFIPPDADPAVVARLHALGARLTVCERKPGERGDPTYNRLLEALTGGALAFSCQGNLNGLAIEGGQTLGWEMAEAVAAAGAQLDRVFVQVGGGALAAACAAGLAEARQLGLAIGRGAFHTVQTFGAHPLERAYGRVAARVAAGESVEEALHYASRHRSEFMWPWEDEPHSIAHGILDDETYDWLAVTRAMLETGGSPLVVEEATLVEANDLARSAAGIDVDPTGSAGLAGLLQLLRNGGIAPDETVAVLFTGVRRSAEPALDQRPFPAAEGRPVNSPREARS